MPLVDLRQARREIRLSWVLKLLGWQPRERRGEQVRGGCPFHGSTSPHSRSFSAHLGRGVWHCFRCDASGNALELWARATGLGLYQAVLDLDDRLGQEGPWLQSVRPAPSVQEKTDVIERSSG
jgi:DNA primase